MKSKLVSGFWDFIKRPVLAAVVIIPPVIGISYYNRDNAIEKEVFNFRYHGIEARVVNVDYPLTRNIKHIELRDGSKIRLGNLVSDNGDTISVNNGYYYINGVKQK